ncbi:hypothetical protein MYX78_10475, partial [Acidobacteria bacterium AH-259-G07]|nr:hypothetical protein [Acidobacteria bacterium AH-259-G07]
MRPSVCFLLAFASVALILGCTHQATGTGDTGHNSETHQTQTSGIRLAPGEARGIRILPGQWRPHCPFEQIAWISPPWASADYILLDYPEAIFSDQGLLYLSHVNPRYPVLFPNLPKVTWRKLPSGLVFDRYLPNGVRFGGRVVKKTASTVELQLYIENGSAKPLTNIRLQTCAYVRAIKEFADFT